LEVLWSGNGRQDKRARDLFRVEAARRWLRLNPGVPVSVCVRATGIGENVMRYCGSFLVVEYMRQGLHPQEACIETIRRIAKMDPKGFDLAINFIAIDRKGRFGAAGTGTGFQYAATSSAFSKVLQSPGLTAADIGPIGGNRK
jgi:hypothetical protein